MPKVIRKLGQKIDDSLQWYEIAGQEFYQDTLVYGQSVLLMPLFNGVALSEFQSDEVLKHLGEKIGEVLQIILVQKGMSQEDHVRALYTPGTIDRGEFFRGHLTHIDLLGVVDDFFACNLDSSVLQKVTKVFQGLQSANPSPLNGQSPSLATATPMPDGGSSG